MTQLCLDFLMLISASHFERAHTLRRKSGWSKLRQKKGESYHERTQSAGSGICTYTSRVKG